LLFFSRALRSSALWKDGAAGLTTVDQKAFSPLATSQRFACLQRP
jgi:hypothetical protein